MSRRPRLRSLGLLAIVFVSAATVWTARQMRAEAPRAGGMWPVVVTPMKQPAVLEPGDDWDAVRAGNLEMMVPPFDDLLRNAGNVIEGKVVAVGAPTFNLPPGETYRVGEELDLQFLTYHTATVRVTRWLLSDGTIDPGQVTLLVPGGCIRHVLTQPDVERLGYADSPGTVAVGDTICSGEPAYGGLHFHTGQRFALVIDRARLELKGARRSIITVAGFGAGAFQVRPDGALVNQAIAPGEYESAPRTVRELETMVRAFA